MKGKKCPYDGAICTGNCLYECPPKRKVPSPPRERIPYIRIVIAVLALGFLVELIGVDHHGPCINTINGNRCGVAAP